MSNSSRLTRRAMWIPPMFGLGLRSDTLLVSIMHANNETGVLQPVLEIAPLVAESNAFFHVDAAQTFGKEVAGAQGAGCDFLSISGHKILGPKGVGALYVKRVGNKRALLAPIIHGGGQEMGPAAGDPPGSADRRVGSRGRTCDARAYRASETSPADHSANSSITSPRVDHVVNGDMSRMQGHVLNVSFPGVDSEALMLAVRDSMAISNGAACSVGELSAKVTS